MHLTVALVVFDDAITERPEAFSVRITNPINSMIGENATAIITVQDTDSKNQYKQSGGFVASHIHNAIAYDARAQWTVCNVISK